ncbi:Lysozyme RrrD [compost metagenome]
MSDQQTSRVPPALRKKLLALAAALAAGVGGAYYGSTTPSEEVLLAMEVGSYYESSGRHIGLPYVDKVGKGQPLTVCNGITGPDVVKGRYYTPEDCKRIELPHYLKAEKLAKSRLRYWDTYNVWVRASFIDVAFNVPSAFEPGTTIMKEANAGNLAAACVQMSRWVMGTVRGVKTRLEGLVGRRGTTQELCAEWGRDGHFSDEAVTKANNSTTQGAP